MNEALIQQVLQEVRRRQQPRALLIGPEPPQPLGWYYVNQSPYLAIVIGTMDAGALLRFPEGACIDALLTGIPIYLWEDGLTYRTFRKTANRAFWSRLLTAEAQLRHLGVRFLRSRREGLLTADMVRSRLRDGLPIEGRLTPLAQDVLEGRA